MSFKVFSGIAILPMDTIEGLAGVNMKKTFLGLL